MDGTDSLQIATTTGGVSEGVQVAGFRDPFAPLYKITDSFFNSGFSFGSVVEILGTLWNIYTFLAFLAALLFLVGYVYATLRKGELVELHDEQIAMMEKAYAQRYGGVMENNRWSEMQAHIQSENPNDWKLAIIEADIMLDDGLKKLGYAGTTLGERLKSISPQQLVTLDDAWEAHKVRNNIAHAGPDFVLTHRLAQDTMKQYERVFTELGIV